MSKPISVNAPQLPNGIGRRENELAIRIFTAGIQEA
jgi:hypothetical protein